MDPIIILIVATVLGCFVLFVVIKKILKFLIAAIALILTAVVAGYLFLTGNGELTKDYLPETEQQKINAFRSQSKEALKEKAGQVKDAAIQKAEQQIENAVQKSKQKIADEITGKPEETTEAPETTETNKETVETIETNTKEKQ